MKRIFFLLLLAVLWSVTASASSVASFEELMARGDAAYARFDNATAMAAFQEALESNPKSYEAAWKLSRVLIDVGEKAQSKEERRQLYLKARQAADKAVEINPSGSKGRLYLAISLGRVALDEGGKEKVKLSKEIKDSLDKALELDPSDDIAWHVLALWHRNVATLSWIERKFAEMFLGGVPKEASVEKAIEYLSKAVALKGTHINHHLELGITYDMLGRRDEAVKEYRLALELPLADSDDADHKAYAEKGLRDVLKPR